MTRPAVKLVFPAAVVLALGWALATATYAAFAWPDALVAIARDRDDGKSFCAGRYGQSDARKRCEDLFDVQYTSERNSALATRALISTAPLLAVGIWAWSRHRSRKRAGGARPTGRRDR